MQWLDNWEEREIVLHVNKDTGQKAGLSISEENNLVMHVHPGSPAAKAGLASNDLVVGVDGERCLAVLGVSAVSLWLRGAERFERKLTVRRAPQTIEQAVIDEERSGIILPPVPQAQQSMSLQPEARLPPVQHQAEEKPAARQPDVRLPPVIAPHEAASAKATLYDVLLPVDEASTASNAAITVLPAITGPGGHGGSKVRRGDWRLSEVYEGLDFQLRGAAARGDDTVLRSLLVPEADLEARDSNGFTALHMAAFNGHVSTASLLLAKGACLDAVNAHGRTPFDLAQAQRRSAMIRLLNSARRSAAKAASARRRKQRGASAYRAADADSPAVDEAVNAEHATAAATDAVLASDVEAAFQMTNDPQEVPMEVPSSSSRRRRRKKSSWKVAGLMRRGAASRVHPVHPPESEEEVPNLEEPPVELADTSWWWADATTIPKTARQAATEAELQALYEKGRVHDGTLVWQQGMGGWKAYGEVKADSAIEIQEAAPATAPEAAPEGEAASEAAAPEVEAASLDVASDEAVSVGAPSSASFAGKAGLARTLLARARDAKQPTAMAPDTAAALASRWRARMSRDLVPPIDEQPSPANAGMAEARPQSELAVPA